MRKEKVPAAIAPEGFQAQQGFIPLLAPVLPRPLETTLRLPTGGFYSSAADGFASSPSSPVIHPVLVFVKVIDLFLHRISRCSRRQFGQNLFQLLHNFDG